MKALYLIIPFAPLLGSILAGLFGKQLGRLPSAIVTILGVLVAFIGSVIVFNDVRAGNVFNGSVYTWAQIGNFKMEIGFLIDNLTTMMMCVVTFVSLMVHIYTMGYMAEDAGYQRFFSYISLFTFSMLMLVMSNNFLQLFFGWEAVGLVSYLLIGFWYNRPTAIFANMKAFLVNRVGDFGFVLGIGLIYAFAGTLDYAEVFAKREELAAMMFPGMDWMLITVICICLFIGAMGKSAQVPLHVWLPDSMEGPTPISALIHAATMVTAGIFMVTRMSPLFELSDTALSFVLIIGSITALFMGFLGIIQNDIKRVVAYSTLSQLGYMTVALGVSAYSVAVFHLMTHAFFKALLFLGSGAVILAYHHEQNIFKMGGLFYKNKFLFAVFAIGGGALAAIPWITVGYYSKDEIIWEAFASGHMNLFWMAVVGAFLTSIYTFRMIWIVFFGEEKTPIHDLKGWTYWLPLAVLLVLSTAVGAMIHPPLAGVLPQSFSVIHPEVEHGKHTAEMIVMAAMLAGLIVGAFLFALDKGRIVSKFTQTGLGRALNYWCYHGLGFDALYDIVFVKPFLLIGKLIKNDPIDRTWNILPALSLAGNRVATWFQSGSIRGYAASFGLGMAVLLVLVMMMIGK